MRRWLFVQLDATAWPGSGLSLANKLFAVTIFLAVAMAILETEPSYRAAVPNLFGVAELFFGVMFGVEYALRLWVAGEDPRYAGVAGRLRYAILPVALIDLLALLPFLLTAGLQDAFLLRMVRLLRLLSLAKFGRYSRALHNIFAALRERQYELLMSLLAAFIVMLLAATALYYTEGSHSPESFGSIPRALWWGVATMTKVGYGGAYPITVLGKLFAGIFAIAAVGVIAMPTGILAAAFSDAFQREREKAKRGQDDQ